MARPLLRPLPRSFLIVITLFPLLFVENIAATAPLENGVARLGHAHGGGEISQYRLGHQTVQVVGICEILRGRGGPADPRNVGPGELADVVVRRRDLGTSCIDPPKQNFSSLLSHDTSSTTPLSPLHIYLVDKSLDKYYPMSYYSHIPQQANN